jgi:hypothetical protein
MEQVTRLLRAAIDGVLERLIAARRMVRRGPSRIDGVGLFTRRALLPDEEIGAVALGGRGRQGRHTLEVGGRHRRVKKPWRYLNHACKPSARLVVSQNSARLYSTRPLAPNSELTIDYNLLPERVSSGFRCHCANCTEHADAIQVGA